MWICKSITIFPASPLPNRIWQKNNSDYNWSIQFHFTFDFPTMVPPIKWSFEDVEIKTEKQADSIVDALDEQERKKLLDALNKKMW